MSLTFDAERHEYKFAGMRVPSVTQILAEVMNWDSVPEDLLERGRERGTAVHALTQAEDEGTLEGWMVPPELAGYLAAYRKFKLAVCPLWHGIEQLVWHPTHRYAGTLDRRGLLRWPLAAVEPAYVDFKTGEDHPAYGLQLSAYVQACGYAAKATPEPKEPNRYVLLLRADGTYKFPKCKTRHRDDFAVFLSLLTARRWKDLHKC